MFTGQNSHTRLVLLWKYGDEEHGNLWFKFLSFLLIDLGQFLLIVKELTKVKFFIRKVWVCCHEVSIVVLIDFIAILLTPGIFLIQTVNTNMYLIHFYSKNNIKMYIPKSWVLKYQNPIRHSLYIIMRWNKLHWQEKSLLSKVTEPNFQKQTIKYINYTYNVIFW